MGQRATYITPLLAQFRHRMDECEHSVQTLSTASGVPRRTVADLLGTRIPLSVSNLEALAAALGCRLTLTVVDDGKEADSARA
jgi:hypothetical protein